MHDSDAKQTALPPRPPTPLKTGTLVLPEVASYYNLNHLTNDLFFVSMKSDDKFIYITNDLQVRRGHANPYGAVPAELIDSKTSRIEFADVTLNLDLARKIHKLNDVKPDALIDLYNLYVIFLKRVPDPEGFEFWIDALNQDVSIDRIAAAFIEAAQKDKALDYAISISDEAFVANTVKHILGQRGWAPNQAEISGWQSKFKADAGYGSLINRLTKELSYNFLGARWLSIIPIFKVNDSQQSTNYDGSDAHQNLVGRYSMAQSTLNGLIYGDYWYFDPLAIKAYREQDKLAIHALSISHEKGNAKPIFTLHQYASQGTYSDLAQQCNNPAAERNWIRSLIDSDYLWQAEVVDTDPNKFSTQAEYFKSLTVKSKDKFSAAVDTATINQFFEEDIELGYGFLHLFSGTENGQAYVVIGEVSANSESQRKGLRRGSRLIEIDGQKITYPLSRAQTNLLYPKFAGEQHRFVAIDPITNNTFELTLSSEKAYINPVQKLKTFDYDNKKFGYLQYQSFSPAGEQKLIDAFNHLKQQEVSELILDLRFNGGGAVTISTLLASMISSERLDKRIFLQFEYNSKNKYPDYLNDFYGVGIFKSQDSKRKPIPRLGLKRVFVLTSNATCSASEAIINGLSPYLDVIIIGGTTCGKPYGFAQKDNCGISYFAISMKVANANKFSDYQAGIRPTCTVQDDMRYALGEPEEKLLATALNYSSSGQCQVMRASNLAPAPFAPAATESLAPTWKSILRTS